MGQDGGGTGEGEARGCLGNGAGHPVVAIPICRCQLGLVYKQVQFQQFKDGGNQRCEKSSARMDGVQGS